MSFFKKLTKDFEDLMGDDKKKDEKPAQADGQRGYEQGGYNSQPQYQQQYNVPPPNQYGPPQGQYNQQYNAPPPGQYNQYGAPPPQQGASLPPTPSVPQGWSPLWDPSGQRWAYLEVSTSKVIWTVPTYASNGNDGSRGQDSGYGGQGAYGGGYGAPAGYGGQGGYNQGQYVDPKEKEKEDKKKMMMGVAGGVAVGAIGGALIANALDDDDQHQGGGGGYPPPMNAPLPEHDADGNSISSSDRESLEEARQEYQEEYEEAYGSD